ncbi:protein of unknown function [Candidatus Nitrotoga arctica]|uniref:Uncharacterized protein n=1 Tax=Candidatus Nitrotoga arctica TaxID=453162 RepID=A0ABN8AI16_9PROT|nr:protein of unknown function [Candidatus Nitrotoga arctica]
MAAQIERIKVGLDLICYFLPVTSLGSCNNGSSSPAIFPANPCLKGPVMQQIRAEHRKF